MTAMLAQPPHAPSLSSPSSPTPIQQTTPLPYTSQAQFTPPSSSEATNNTSPISPRQTWNVPPHLQMQTRQIRAPKLPMYVPAVLRPTEKPQRSSPPKFGSRGSVDNVHGLETSAGGISGLRRIVTEEWNEEVLGPVTGLPSRNHWKPDTSSPKCDDATCEKDFTFLNRRHHCRRCGRIYCAPHSAHYVPLDQYARFHPNASTHRACDACWSDYKAWDNARTSRSNSRDSTTPGTPIPGSGRKFNDGMKAPASVAASVPRDWNWSTF